MTETKVKGTSSLFKVRIGQRHNTQLSDCNVESNTHLPNYAIAVNNVDQTDESYVILSYSTLVDLLNNQLPYAFLNETNSSLLTNLKPLIFDPRYANRTKNTTGCVSYAIYCSFPFQCILSHPSEPLLARIKAYYDVLLGIFKNALPGNRKNLRSILNQNGTQGQFQIPQPGCYNNAECYGIGPDSEYQSTIIESARLQMANKERELLEQPFFLKYKRNENCGKLAFMCNAAGDCSTLLLSELYQESKRGISYIRKYINYIYILEGLVVDDSPFYYPEGNACRNLHLYCDNTNQFTIFQQEAFPLLPFFNQYYNIINAVISRFFRLMTNIRENELCSNIRCLEISFEKISTNETSPTGIKLKNKELFGIPSAITFYDFIQKIKPKKLTTINPSAEQSTVLPINYTANTSTENSTKQSSPDSQQTLNRASNSMYSLLVAACIITALFIVFAMKSTKNDQRIQFDSG